MAAGILVLEGNELREGETKAGNEADLVLVLALVWL